MKKPARYSPETSFSSWVPDEVSLHLTRTPFVPVEVSLDLARLVSEHETLREAVRALSGVSDVRARKGSLWVLSLDGGTLVDAHYTARLLEPA